MHIMSRFPAYGLLVATGAILCSHAPTAAGPQSAAAMASEARTIVHTVGRRWSPYWYDGGAIEYDRPPMPPVRVYRYGPPPPVVVYEPPVYGWIAPPPPASCGKYRYWNGEYCADARDEPPYVGPR